MKNLARHDTMAATLRYISRPDLSPPKINITLPLSSANAARHPGGYIFATPCPLFDAPPGGAGPVQQGAYILRQDGDLVWSSLGYLGGWAANFHVASYRGRPVLQCFTGVLAKKHAHAFGTVVLLDGEYKTVRSLQSLEGLVSFHEGRVLDACSGDRGEEIAVGDECGGHGRWETGGGQGEWKTTALVQIHQPRLMDLHEFGGREGQRWIVEDIFQEIDIETNKPVLSASSLSFALPRDSCLPLSQLPPRTGTSPENAWDYFHTNSLDKDSAGDYLVSGRHMSTVYKISGTNGSCIWQLGGKSSTFRFLDGLQFGFQHHARFRGHGCTDNDKKQKETISLFDNHFRSDQQHWGKPSPSPSPAAEGTQKEVPQSAGLIIELDHRDKTARQVARFVAPTTTATSPLTQGGKGLSVGSQGNLQILPDGNAFVNWGVEGAVTEYRCRRNGGDLEPEPEPIFHAFLDSAPGTQSYRAFKCPWEGISREKIAVVALKSTRSGGGGRNKVVIVEVFISWNGDTRTREWRVFLADSSALVGRAERVSFETAVEVDLSSVVWAGEEDVDRRKAVRIFVVALDQNGQEIGRSDLVEIGDDVGILSEEGFHSEANKVWA